MNELVIGAISTLGSGLFGGIGAIVQKVLTTRQEIKTQELKLQELKLIHAHELQMTQAGNGAKLELMDRETELKIIQGEYKGLIASMEADRATYSVTNPQSKMLLWVDFIRGIMRPLLTGALTVYIGLAIVYITYRYNVTLSQDQVYDLLYHLILCVTSSANIALTWWFGSRKLSDMGK